MGNTISMLPRWRSNLPRTKVKLSSVKISDDCCIDVLKFLTCAEWSEKRCVSRQINGVVECNISRLPRAIFQKAILGEDYLVPKLRQVEDDAIVAFGAIIPQSKIEQWFVNRGITLESRVQFQMPAEAIPTEKVLLGNYWDSTDMCILASAQQHSQEQKTWIEHLFRKQESSHESVLFYSQFRPAAKFSWASLEHFLTFLFHPLSYIKMVEMFAVDQKFIDAVKEKIVDNSPIPGNTMHPQKCIKNWPLYIHCETFSLRYKTGMSIYDLHDILMWLQRNVRADSLRMSSLGVYTDSEDSDAVYRLLTDFVFGALRICVKRELRIRLVHESNLLISLIEKFWTLDKIEREIPAIVLELFFTHIIEQIGQELGPNVIHQEVDSEGADFLFVFENGHNQMRISFCHSVAFPLPNKYDCFVKFYAIQPFL
ncbi:hypothetical protein DdX_17524 [Ditylenchus destructor]|uniref:Uncharacterized protein n=1 Tax=Ditylenchus destructor TaxID=166010 RepID=A0AAD4MNA6_9BILA|nr:hypothetical protein DdX_17524 [Ditylenchus destructor]